MIKLNRTTEYGLIALRHMSRKRVVEPIGVTSAREISDQYGFPFEITAKTLQKLRDLGLIDSAQGARGGYTLRRELEEITLAEFLQLMEGPQSVVSCVGKPASAESKSAESKSESGKPCEYANRCEVMGVMNDLNSRVVRFLSGINLAELAERPQDRLSGKIVGIEGFAKALES